MDYTILVILTNWRIAEEGRVWPRSATGRGWLGAEACRAPMRGVR